MCGLRSEPASDAFVREWRAMLEYAFSSPRWSFDLTKRWFKLEEMWCVLIGFDWASRAFRKFVTSYSRLCPRRKYDIGSKAT